MDQMVAGIAPATMAAAEHGGAWRQRCTVREGEGGEVDEHQELTPETMARTERHGADRSGGEELGGAAAVVGAGADGGDDSGHPGPIHPAGRCSTAGRC